MIYRDFGKTGPKVSAIGVGCKYVWTADEQTVCDMVRAAVNTGVNYFDLFVGTPSTREYYGKALKGLLELTPVQCISYTLSIPQVACPVPLRHRR